MRMANGHVVVARDAGDLVVASQAPQWLVGTIDAASTASLWRKSVTSGPSRIKVVQLGVGGRQIEWL